VIRVGSERENTLAMRPNRQQAEEAIRKLIAWTGDNPTRDGLIGTPRRVINAFGESFAGYRRNAADVFARACDEIESHDDVVVVRDIPFNSHCEHHMLPFFGHAHIAYYPDGRVMGLSKAAGAIDVFALRLQTQERLTAEIAHAVDDALKPRGVAVMLEAEHQCMTLRGVRKPGALTTTTAFTGVFKSDPAEQVRFLSLVRAERGRRLSAPRP
jgi:GTP cyclohydrolase IA